MYFTRLARFWGPGWQGFVWLLLGLFPLYFFQTFIHEFSHAVAAAAATGSFPPIAPFPHLSKDGDFLNGVTLGGGGFIATPEFVALGLVVIFSLIAWLAPIRIEGIRFAFKVWYLGAAIDLCYNTVRELFGGHNPSADWSRFQDACDIPQAGMVVLSFVIWLVVLAHFAWVYFSAWTREEGSRMTFWHYRVAAFVFGAISLVAIIWSLAMSHPHVLKDNAAFIVPLILQILSFVWYVVYIVLTFTVRRPA